MYTFVHKLGVSNILVLSEINTLIQQGHIKCQDIYNFTKKIPSKTNTVLLHFLFIKES